VQIRTLEEAIISNRPGEPFVIRDEPVAGIGEIVAELPTDPATWLEWQATTAAPSLDDVVAWATQWTPERAPSDLDRAVEAVVSAPDFDTAKANLQALVDQQAAA
jgi:hypothetical protein